MNVWQLSNLRVSIQDRVREIPGNFRFRVFSSLKISMLRQKQPTDSRFAYIKKVDACVSICSNERVSLKSHPSLFILHPRLFVLYTSEKHVNRCQGSGIDKDIHSS